jgi:hypothetical protein
LSRRKLGWINWLLHRGSRLRSTVDHVNYGGTSSASPIVRTGIIVIITGILRSVIVVAVVGLLVVAAATAVAIPVGTSCWAIRLVICESFNKESG